MLPRASDSESPPPVGIGWPTLFVAFSQMSLSGFGGVLPFAYRMLVERRRWLTPSDFAAQLAFAQILPGPSVMNLAVMVGWRACGVRGAVAAFAGVLLGPMCLVIALGFVYMHTASLPLVRHALAGMAAVAAGLVIATAVKMATGVVRSDRRPARMAVAALFALLAFVGVGVLRWPLLAVALGLAPFAIAAAWPAREARGGR